MQALIEKQIFDLWLGKEEKQPQQSSIILFIIAQTNMQEQSLIATHLFTSRPAFIKINKKELSPLQGKEDNESIDTLYQPNPFLSKGCILVPYNSRTYKNSQLESIPRKNKHRKWCQSVSSAQN